MDSESTEFLDTLHVAAGPESTFNPVLQSVLADEVPTMSRVPEPTLPTMEPNEAEPIPVSTDGGGVGSGPASFQLQKLVARGGCGVIWEALQVSLSRVIAVKMVREDYFKEKGFSQESSIDRRREMLALFRQEALAAAGLEHPNIVPVHDLGFDEAGQPLLAMKLVRGTPWHEAIHADRKLPSPEFLARHLPILIDVCQAVDFAHSKGIIHRDLKPSQVMLGEFGEVLLMDWGLAVHLPDRDSTEIPRKIRSTKLPTPMTASNPAGTPAYMAPEQTLRSAAEIGEWTDVYLLGGILYQLLTLTVPHSGDVSKEVLKKAAAGKVERPTKRAPNRLVPQQLEEIAMRALHRERGRRFGSVRDLIKSIQDYMSGATQRTHSLELSRLVEGALDGGSLTYREFGKCHVQLEEARSLWNENPRLESLRERLQESHCRAALANKDLVLARLQAERIAETDEGASLLEEIGAAEQQVAQRERQRRMGIAASFLFLTMLIVVGGVFAFYQSAARQREASFIADLEAANASLTEGNDLLRAEKARTVAARDDAEELVSFMLNDLADKLIPLGKLDILGDAGGQALEYYRNLPEEDLEGGAAENLVLALLNLGEVFLKQGDFKSAGETFEEARRRAELLVQEDPENMKRRRQYAGTLDRITDFFIGGERFEEALVVSRSSLEVLEGLAEEDPDSHEHMRNLGVGYLKVGKTLTRLEEFDEALEVFEDCLEVRRELDELRPDDALIKNDLAAVYDQIGKAKEGIGDTKSAMASHMESLRYLQEVVELDPENLMWAGNLAISRANVGDSLLQIDEPERALDQFRQAAEIGAQLVEHDPTNVVWQNVQAWNYRRISWANADMEMYDDSIEAAEQMIAIYTALRDGDDTGHWDITLANSYEHIGETCRDAGYFDRAYEYHEMARSIRDPFLTGGETEIAVRMDEYLNNYFRASSLAGGGKPVEARALIDESLVRLRERLEGESTVNEAARQSYQEHAIHGAVIHYATDNQDTAFQLLAEAGRVGPISEFWLTSDDLRKMRESDPERFARAVEGR